MKTFGYEKHEVDASRIYGERVEREAALKRATKFFFGDTNIELLPALEIRSPLRGGNSRPYYVRAWAAKAEGFEWTWVATVGRGPGRKPLMASWNRCPGAFPIETDSGIEWFEEVKDAN